MIDKSHFYVVIMAGGGGTRLWPWSTKDTPKQMVQLFGKDTLYQNSVNRLKGLLPPENIFIVTSEKQAKTLTKQTPEIPERNFILEPSAKGTAAAIGLAAMYIKKIYPEAIMAVLTADHFIENIPAFHNLLSAGYHTAKDQHLVTLGIEPTFPATGFGYINKGQFLKEFHGLQSYVVRKFIEKPDKEKAEMMFASGEFLWNSGMFIWQVGRVLNEFEKQMPELFDVLKQVDEFLDGGGISNLTFPEWERLKPQSIDYGIMENADDVVVLPAKDLGWIDVGSWDALFDILEADEFGNIIKARNHYEVNSVNNLIFSENDAKLIVTLGVKDLVIVETEKVVLVADKNKSQEIKNIVQYLDQNGLDVYL